jgi:hypothetical protein
MPTYSEVSHKWNTIANLIGMRFPFCKTGLRNAWTNYHNLRQDCNLEELVNQANLPSNKLHQRSMATIAWTQMSRESLPT